MTVAEDGQVTVNLVASDIEDDTLTYAIVSGPSNGTLEGTGASRVYTPNLNYFGTDSFTYKVNDGELNSNVSTVSITVTSVNDLPVIAGSQQVEVNPPANGYFNVFSGMTLTDVDDDGQALLDVELLLVNHANGTLIDPSGAMTLLDQTYKVSGLSPTQMTAVLQGLRFTPTPNSRPSLRDTFYS